jgi:hypothetical protein
MIMTTTRSPHSGREFDFLWFHLTGDETIDVALHQSGLLVGITAAIFTFVPLVATKKLFVMLENPITFFLLCITFIDMGWVVGGLLVYFPLPSYITFGQQIGGVLPATCAANLAYEGASSLPCTLARFRDVLTRPDWQWNEIEGDWTALAIMATLLMIPPIATVVVFVIDKFFYKMYPTKEPGAMLNEMAESKRAWDPAAGDMKPHGARTEKSDSLV